MMDTRPDETKGCVLTWRRGWLQGHLAHKKQRPPMTLQQDFAKGPMVVLRGGGGISYEGGTPVHELHHTQARPFALESYSKKMNLKTLMQRSSLHRMIFTSGIKDSCSKLHCIKVLDLLTRWRNGTTKCGDSFSLPSEGGTT